MHTDDHSDPLVDLGYEERDINPRIIFKVSMFFFGFAFVSFVLGWVILYFFGYWKSADGVNDLMSSKIPKSPNPILQTNVTAKTDIKDMRIKERKELTSAGPSTHVTGANRIPIEQAIKLAAARGAKLSAAPAVTTSPVAPTGGSQ